MAVYYKWIKGCAAGANLTEGQWSYITWGSASTSTTGVLPTLKISTGKDDNLTSSTDLGYFLTNNVSDVVIEKAWTFKDNLYFNGSTSEGTLSHDTYGNLTFNKNFTIGAEKSEPGHLTVINTTSDGTKQEAFQVIGNTVLDGTTIISETLTVSGTASFNSSITVSKGCNAVYFNATSDKRAKENFSVLEKSLDFISGLKLYTFNYKGQTDKVPGLLAQDLLETQKELNIDLVNNIEAGGENGDYMTIKEGKLVYLCLQAIQELNNKVKNLETEIEKLKNNQ